VFSSVARWRCIYYLRARHPNRRGETRDPSSTRINCRNLFSCSKNQVAASVNAIAALHSSHGMAPASVPAERQILLAKNT